VSDPTDVSAIEGIELYRAAKGERQGAEFHAVLPASVMVPSVLSRAALSSVQSV